MIGYVSFVFPFLSDPVSLNKTTSLVNPPPSPHSKSQRSTSRPQLHFIFLICAFFCIGDLASHTCVSFRSYDFGLLRCLFVKDLTDVLRDPKNISFLVTAFARLLFFKGVFLSVKTLCPRFQPLPCRAAVKVREIRYSFPLFLFTNVFDSNKGKVSLPHYQCILLIMGQAPRT